jgi:hypothetical protein
LAPFTEQFNALDQARDFHLAVMRRDIAVIISEQILSILKTGTSGPQAHPKYVTQTMNTYSGLPSPSLSSSKRQNSG